MSGVALGYCMRINNRRILKGAHKGVGLSVAVLNNESTNVILQTGTGYKDWHGEIWTKRHFYGRG